VSGTLAADGWAVTFSTARRGVGGLRPRPVPCCNSHLCQGGGYAIWSVWLSFCLSVRSLA